MGIGIGMGMGMTKPPPPPPQPPQQQPPPQPPNPPNPPKPPPKKGKGNMPWQLPLGQGCGVGGVGAGWYGMVCTCEEISLVDGATYVRDLVAKGAWGWARSWARSWVRSRWAKKGLASAATTAKTTETRSARRWGNTRGSPLAGRCWFHHHLRRRGHATCGVHGCRKRRTAAVVGRPGGRAHGWASWHSVVRHAARRLAVVVVASAAGRRGACRRRLEAGQLVAPLRDWVKHGAVGLLGDATTGI